jgi:uncharacterized protein involved in exopolysaccharide biosynthesis/Mrp family chromosome partitioning ATPase
VIEDLTMTDYVPFAKLLAILRRRRGVVLLFALVGAVAAATLGAWMPPRYTAKALLVVQFPPTVPNASSLSSANDDAVVQTQVAALEAPNRLYNVLTGFAHDPEVTAALNGDQRPRPAESTTPRMSAHTDPASISRVVGDVWDSLSVHISSFATDVGHALLGGEPERNLTGLARLGPEDLKRRLTIQQEHGSHVIAVSMTWTDPEIAAAFANRAVRLYLESEKERTDKDLASEMSWIDARIREESAKYERAHAAVQAYRTAHLRADQKELFDRQIADLQRQLAPGQTELIVPRVAALEQRMAALQRARDQASRDSYALADLEREAAVYRQAYEDLQQRRRQLAERQEVVAPQVRLLSLAKPPNKPSSLAPILFIPPAIIVFATLGSLVAVIRDRLDRSIRGQSDIDEALGLPCLTFVPRLTTRKDTKPHQDLVDNPLAPYAEAIRSLAAATDLPLEGGQSEVLLISSSLPGEGKTTLAASIAVHAATLGRRVLLMDLDSRRSSIMCEVGAQIEGTVPFSLSFRPETKAIDPLITGAIKHISGLGIDYLPMRSHGCEPLLLYAGDRLSHFIDSLRGAYDFIVLDGPPLLIVAEARMLAKLADKILFVVKWGSTTREVAQAGYALLAAANAAGKILGAVVMQVNVKRHARGRYGGPPEYLQRHSAHLAISKAAEAPPGVPTDIQRTWRRPATGLIAACLIAGAGAVGFLYQNGAADHVDMTNAAITGTGDRAAPVGQGAQQREIETRMAAALTEVSEAARAREAAEQTAATAQQALQEERSRTEALGRDLDAARREIETQTAAARTASTEAAHAKGAAERSAIELGQALKQEHDKGEVLAGELAKARRELQTQVATLANAAGDRAARDQQLGELRKALGKAEASAAAYQDALAQQSARNQKLKLQLSQREATPEREEKATAQLPESPVTTPPPAPDKAATASPPASDKPLMAVALAHDRPVTTTRPTAPHGAASPEAARLIARAGQLLIEGNVGAARLVLDRAAEMGSAQAWFLLAQTYDPLSLSAWGTLGTQGDPAKAQELYTKALVGGVQEAKDRLNALRQ